MFTQQKSPEFEHAQLLLVGVVLACVLAVYWDTFSRIVAMWSFSDYQYGWLVYPLGLYLLMAERDSLAQASVQPSKRGAALAAGTVLVLLVARVTGTQVIEFISFTFLFFAVCLAIVGTTATRVITFPLLFLITSVPVGGFLVEPLMELTAEIAWTLLTWSGIPVHRDGQFFYLSGGSFEVDARRG